MSKHETINIRGLALNSKEQERLSIGRSWFFGIGINHYKYFPKLNNAVKDVQDVKSLLLDLYNFESPYVITLFNELATRDNIITTLDQLQKKIQPKDKLLLYYSGHGHLIKVGEREKGFWIPFDAEKNNTAKYLRNTTILDYIQDINTLHTLLISDSCFSGSLFVRGVSRTTSAMEELEKRKSRWAISSGRHDEEVYDGVPGKNSPFADSILNILRTNNLDKLNVAKLADQVVELTRANYKQLPEGNPLYGVGHKGGQYMFNLKTNEAKAWKACVNSESLAIYQNFVEKYPNSIYKEAAISTLKELQKEAGIKNTITSEIDSSNSPLNQMLIQVGMILILAIGWAISWIISNVFFKMNSMSPLKFSGYIMTWWALGGFFTGMALKWIYIKLDWKHVLQIFISWLVPGILFLTIIMIAQEISILLIASLLIVFGAIGGFFTGRIMKTIYPVLRMKQVFIIAVGWAVATFASEMIGVGLASAIEPKWLFLGVNPATVIKAIFAGVGAGGIGGGVMFYQLRKL